MLVLAQIPDPTNVIDTASRYSWEAGLLAFLVVVSVLGLGYAAWKITWYVVYAVIGNESKGTLGLAGRWVAGELEWRSVLTKQLGVQTDRLELQTEACTLHIDTVKAMGDSLAAQIEAAKLARDAASLAAESAAAGNASLKHIDDVLNGRTDVIHRTAEGVQQLKACVFHLCDTCQMFVAKEFPASAGEVSAYLLAAKKKINDERV
jgi:hypothetical protein